MNRLQVGIVGGILKVEEIEYQKNGSTNRLYVLKIFDGDNQIDILTNYDNYKALNELEFMKTIKCRVTAQADTQNQQPVMRLRLNEYKVVNEGE